MDDRPLHIRTPLLYSTVLSRTAGCHVYLKLENTQPSGSFKTRGLGALATSVFREHGAKAHLVCSSGGNAGLACAHAGMALGLRATIFVPTSTKPGTVRLLEGYGAKVVQGGAHWFEADLGARALVAAQAEAVYCPPFDHPKVVEGNSTIVKEVLEQLAEQGASPLASIVASVGGGGLLAGILQGLFASGAEVPVLACETSGAASLRLASRASFATSPPVAKVERLAGITSIASSLGATAVSQQVIDLAVSHPGGVVSVVMEDARTLAAVRAFMDDHGFFVEPACAAALTPIYQPNILRAALPHIVFPLAGATPAKDAPSVVIVVCGGNTVTLEQFLQWEIQGAALGAVSLFDGRRGLDVQV